MSVTLVPSKLLSEIFEYDTPSDNPLQNRRLPRQPQAPDPRSTSTLIARQRGGNANRDGRGSRQLHRLYVEQRELGASLASLAPNFDSLPPDHYK